MPGDVSIDIGSAIPYAVDGVLALFGKDAMTAAAQTRLTRRIRIAIEQASQVQCIGMDRSISIFDIYQSTRLLTSQHSPTADVTDLTRLIDRHENAVIFAGPGSGKTILLNWTLLEVLKRRPLVPLLFSLRTPGATEDLRTFVDDLSAARVIRGKDSHVVLLVDGYDEVGAEARKEVSKILQDFASLKRGNFYLTCRRYYTVVDLKAANYYIEPFGEQSARRFLSSFLQAYGVAYDTDQLVKELRARGFEDFLGSPLMLTLVCILKSGPLPHLPRNAIGLIRRALDTLTFRWDEQKGVSRAGEVPLDGEERIRCLMRLAFRFDRPIGLESVAHTTAEEHIRILQRTDVSAGRLLNELAQWYGIFVPTSDGQWCFVHRTIHDFLAARFWVEGGTFFRSLLTPLRWDTRTAYAACLIPDATRWLVKALEVQRELHFFIECLGNNALFDVGEVSKAVVRHFRPIKPPHGLTYERTRDKLQVSLKQDFLRLASEEFLDALVEAGAAGRGRSHDIVYALSLAECRRRNRSAQHLVRDDLTTVQLCVGIGDQDVDPFHVTDLLLPG